MFFVMERMRENLPRMHKRVCGAGAHLHCVSNKPMNKFRNTFIYGHAKIDHHKKIAAILYIMVHKVRAHLQIPISL